MQQTLTKFSRCPRAAVFALFRRRSSRAILCYMWSNFHPLAEWACLPRPARWAFLVALLATLLALALDVAHLSGALPAPLDGVFWSEQLRFGRTVACALVGWLCWAAARERVDAAWLVAACLLCVPADFYLILARDLKTGIGIFLVVQMVFIVRHARSLVWHRLAARRYTVAAALTLALYAVGNAVLYPLLAPKGLAVPVMAYSAVLLLACLSAWCLTSDPRYPTVNARLAFAGMVLFVLCDITVGAGAALHPSLAGEVVRAATGLFYTPSLLLLAISATNFEPR